MSNPDFESLVGGDDLGAQERASLLAAHEALLIAGPPAELPPALASPPRVGGEVVTFPNVRRRTTLLIAAAIALVAFALGTATSSKSGDAFAAAWKYQMSGTARAPHASATLSGSKKDASGNWHMVVRAHGLPALKGNQYYIVWLTIHGKPIAQCGSFNVRNGEAVASFSEPYELKHFDGWVVTLWRGPKAPVGPALLKTATI